MALRVPSRSFAKKNLAKYLMVRSARPPSALPHIVQRYGETLNALQVSLDEAGLEMYLTPEQEKQAQDELLQWGYPHPLAVVLGATHATKRWPQEYFEQLINQVRQPVLLIGGPDAREEATWLVERLQVPVFDAVGKYALLQSAALLKQARTVIAHDTGFMHIAAAFGQRVISLWGNTVPEMGMTPYRTHYEIAEVKGLACRPCSKIGHDQCPQGHFRCMRDLKPSRVAAFLQPQAGSGFTDPQ